MAAEDTGHKPALEDEVWTICNAEAAEDQTQKTATTPVATEEEVCKELNDLLYYFSDIEHKLHSALTCTQSTRAKIIQIVQRRGNMGVDKQKVFVYEKGDCYHSGCCAASGTAKTIPEAVTKTCAAEELEMRQCKCKACERA